VDKWVKINGEMQKFIRQKETIKTAGYEKNGFISLYVENFNFQGY